MNFRKEADPSGVKGLLALLRTNQDGGPPASSTSSTGTTHANVPYGSSHHAGGQRPMARPYGPPGYGSGTSADRQASYRPSPPPSSAHTAQWTQPAGDSTSSRASDTPVAAPHPLDHPDAATNHSYLAQWETETRALNDARKVGGGKAGDGAGVQHTIMKETTSIGKGSPSTTQSNPELTALLNSLRSTGAITSPPASSIPSTAGPSRTVPTSTPAHSAPTVIPATVATSTRQPKSILKLTAPSASSFSPRTAREEALSRYSPHSRVSDPPDSDRSPKRRKMGMADEDGEPVRSAGLGGKSTGFSVASIRSSVVDEGGARKGDSTLSLRRKERTADETIETAVDHALAASPALSVKKADGSGGVAMPKKDLISLEDSQRSMPFAQALGIMAGLLESADIVAKLQQLKRDQDALERECHAEREKLVKAFDKRIAHAGNRNDPAEAARLANEKRRHLKQYDSSLLERFDELGSKQHRQLEAIGVPGLGVDHGYKGGTEALVPGGADAAFVELQSKAPEMRNDDQMKEKEWRKRRAKVMKVLEEGIEVD